MSLTPEQIEAGWVEHDGRFWPDALRLSQVVTVLRRDGSTATGEAGSFNGLDWYHGESVFSPSCDIIAYHPEVRHD